MKRLQFQRRDRQLSAEHRNENPTKAEQELRRIVKYWNKYKYQTEYEVAAFWLDLYIHDLRLCIEADGSVHQTEERKKKDHKRDRYLRFNYSISTLRLPNDLILNQPAEALKRIIQRARTIEALKIKYPDMNIKYRYALPD